MSLSSCLSALWLVLNDDKRVYGVVTDILVVQGGKGE